MSTKLCRKSVLGLAVILAIQAFSGCSGSTTDPTPDDGLPPPGTSGSGITDVSGTARLSLKGVPVDVSVIDAQGAPAAGINVGATVGKDVIALVAAHPGGGAPGLALYSRAQFKSLSAVVGSVGENEQAIVIPFLVVKLAITAVSGGLAIWELYHDPIHQKLIIDEGILKTCIAGDIRDLVAMLGTFVSTGIHTTAFVLSSSKASTFGLALDASLIPLTGLLELLEWTDTDRVLPGTCTVLVGDKDFSGLLVIVSGVVGGGIFAQDNRTPSALYVVEPTSTGSDLEVARLRTTTGASPQITDMAHWDTGRAQNPNAALSHPVLYAVSFNTLYRLNRRTGVAEPQGALGNRGINSLAFDPQGKLFAAGSSGELLQLDPATGAILQVRPLSPAVALSGDLAFLSSGRLLGTILGNSGGDILAEFNPATGAVQPIGNVGFTGVFGLSYFDGVLWGLTVNNQLLRIDTSTGGGTLVRQLSFRANGGSIAPE